MPMTFNSNNPYLTWTPQWATLCPPIVVPCRIQPVPMFLVQSSPPSRLYLKIAITTLMEWIRCMTLFLTNCGDISRQSARGGENPESLLPMVEFFLPLLLSFPGHHDQKFRKFYDTRSILVKLIDYSLKIQKIQSWQAENKVHVLVLEAALLDSLYRINFHEREGKRI